MPYPWGQIWARGKFKSEVSVKYLLIFIDMIVYCVTKDILTRAGWTGQYWRPDHADQACSTYVAESRADIRRP